MSLVNQAENQDNQISKVFKCSWEVEDIWCKVGVAASWLLIPLYIPHYPKHHTAPTYFLHQAPHPLIILHLVTSAPTTSAPITSAFHYTAPTCITSNRHTLHHTAPIYPPTSPLHTVCTVQKDIATSKPLESSLYCDPYRPPSSPWALLSIAPFPNLSPSSTVSYPHFKKTSGKYTKKYVQRHNKQT